MDSSIIAKVCHEANLVLCHFNGEDTQKNWNECPQDERESFVERVESRISNPESEKPDYDKLPVGQEAKDILFNAIVDGLKALIPASEPKEEMVDVLVTEEMLAKNPEMVEAGIKSGETIQVTKAEFDKAEAKAKKAAEKAAKKVAGGK